MLPKGKRLSRQAFEDVFAKSSVRHGEHLLVRFIKSASKESHGAVVVSKRVARSAVKRNTTKRRIYSCLQGMFQKLPYHLDVIVIVKKSIVAVSPDELCKEIKGIFSSIA